MSIRFDLSGADVFLSHLNNQTPLAQVLEHPAYQAIAHHAQLFGDGLHIQDVTEALEGRPSPFYGLEQLFPNLPRILELAAFIRQHAADWAATITAEWQALLPGENPEITIYPVIGYDMGIGLDGAVCMNLNCNTYLENPLEFLFYAVHECTHVIYDRCHTIPALAQVNTPTEWRAYFNLWTQNEGFAVYAPLALRQKSGGLDERDYRVLSDAAQLERHRLAFLRVLEKLQNEAPLPRDEYLDACFGDMRLTYRLGCELFRRIAQAQGPAAAQRAFYLDGCLFMERYRSLLNH